MIILRKAKKVLLKADSTYSLVDKPEFSSILTKAGASEKQITSIKTFLRQNAFTLAIIGSKASIGNGYMVEGASNE